MSNSLPLRSFLIAMFLVFPLSLSANFDFNANCLKAYQNIFELKLGTARQLIAAEKKTNPKNAIVPLLENYADYFYLLTSESKQEFDRLEKSKSKRLDLIEEGDSSSPYYLYAQAEINLQWALIRGRYGEYFTAAREIKKANGLLLDNQKKFPSFQLNAKGLGLINAFLGNLPDGILKSTLATLGIKGNLQTGIVMLDKLADGLPSSKFEPFYEEVVFYYAFVLNDIAHSPVAYAKTMKYTARISDASLLKTYLQALVSAKNGHNDEAISILERKPTGPAYQAFPYLDFLEGAAKLNKLDYSSSADFGRFLRTNKGVNYIKDANLHLGWISLLKGDTEAYSGFMAKVKSNGYAYQEKDKQAFNEANEAMPNKSLLKARLLFDGGYHDKALDLLWDAKPEGFSAGRDRTEFYYRRGRINDELNKEDAALSDYQNAINSGKGLRYYFAANAALQIGKIYENKKNYAKARQAYNLAIQMKNHDYESSIETQAKAGLNRMK
ncbi:tetratricopeptide repeat protein [Pedobacter frigoris]|uniref:Tetratricopeptide repeat protein n=1 Tax=Pedobacter frigoris TaxID=2571272 RepID=A0A4U1CGF4_9SPHI|nr:tetratricopeptide repeat protein [Pedobacter frigoris]TKC04922.1 tetratricopeptide repeat protein [Pedobacter frigoris]